MIVPPLGAADLDHLARVFPHLKLDDERRAVLLERGTIDVNAAPGSGKTTVLVAKLYLLARRWSDPRRGICVISHTNVARQEIQERLGATPEGERLLQYPHFIGTIHSFVNQFLALPWLRSRGLVVEAIDDKVFAERAMSVAHRNHTIKKWMDRKYAARGAIESMRFVGPALEIEAANGALPGEQSPTGSALREIKREIARRGIFRHDDMFSFAEALLRTHPHVTDRLSHRFPVVFIDEMQDTTLAQEGLLDRAFSDRVVRQRYGDVNQNILGDRSATSFPRQGHLSIRTSKRFGPSIAKAVSLVQVEGPPVVGERSDEAPNPVLLLYDTERVRDVISQFGRLVLERFTDNVLADGSVHALCTRRQGNAKKAPGRHLGDYWHAFGSMEAATTGLENQLPRYLVNAAPGLARPESLAERAHAIKRALLLILRHAPSVFVEDIRDARALPRTLERAGFGTDSFKLLVRDLVLSENLVRGGMLTADAVVRIYQALKDLLPERLSEREFADLPVFSERTSVSTERLDRHDECVVEEGGRVLRIHLGTTASKKGQTHLASLVLESYCTSQYFDIADALPFLSGLQSLTPHMSDPRKQQFRNLYVAMSRPTHFLALAVNSERADPRYVSALEGKGWEIQRLT